MEATIIIHIPINSVPERNFIMHWIVSDDDSIMCEILHHPKDDLKDKGKFPIWVVEPKFIHFYKLDTTNVGTYRVSENMA